MPASPLTPAQLEDAARLRSAFEDAKLKNPSMTQEALAALCGWKTQGAVSQYLNGKIPLNLKALLRFCEHLGRIPAEISPVLAADLSLLPSTDTQKSLKDAESAHANDADSAMLLNFPETTQKTTRASGNYVIRQYASGGAMGHGLTLPDQPGVIENWSVSREWLNKNVRNITGVKNLCIVTGFGPSMQPMYNPGDPLLVDTGVKQVIADGVYFFRVGENGYIKQLQMIPTETGVKYVAKSKNPDFDPFDITETMDFEVLGKVVRVWCGTDF